VSLTAMQQVEASMGNAVKGGKRVTGKRKLYGYRELLENANDMIYVHDLRGTFFRGTYTAAYF